MKRLLLLIGLMLGFTAPASVAHAQNCGVNYVPTVGVTCTTLRQNTYVASILKLVPASSATDFFCINGSSSKTVHIDHWYVASTGTGASFPVSLNLNVGLDTGTAAVAATYGPIPEPYNPNNPAATATTVAYNSTGGNPTIGGTTTTLRQGVIMTALATTPVVSQPIDWHFGSSQEEQFDQHLIIPSGQTTYQYCLNLNATSPGGTLNGWVQWTEY